MLVSGVVEIIENASFTKEVFMISPEMLSSIHNAENAEMLSDILQASIAVTKVPLFVIADQLVDHAVSPADLQHHRQVADQMQREYRLDGKDVYFLYDDDENVKFVMYVDSGETPRLLRYISYAKRVVRNGKFVVETMGDVMEFLFVKSCELGFHRKDVSVPVFAFAGVTGVDFENPFEAACPSG